MKKLALCIVLFAAVALTQSPVAFGPFFGQYVDYWVAHTNISGDTYAFQSWGNAAALALMPDPTGFPVLGALNDGGTGGCSGNIEILQISKLPPFNTAPTSGNTLLTPLPCLTSFGTAPGDTNAPGNWSGHLTGGDGHNDGTWKGANMSFHGGFLDFCPFRQTSAGTAFGDSTCIMSPDAGNTWVDYGNYSAFTVTGAVCVSTTATLTVTNTLSGGAVVYIHDVGSSTANVYNGKYTLTSATGATMVYTVPSCTGGTYTSGGAVGPLVAGGSAPLGPSSGSYPADVMFPVSGGHNPMTQQFFILQGQDGSFPEELSGTGCDPNVWVCGYSVDATFVQSNQPSPVVLFRFPVGKGLVLSLHQWYVCAGYSAFFGTANPVCDGNKSGNWTSTEANATVLFYQYQQPPSADSSGWRPTAFFGARYIPTFRSYVISANIVYFGTFHYRWAPQPWGPFYSMGNIQRCPASAVNCNDFGFDTLMGIGENVVSTTPPDVQSRMAQSVNLGVNTGAGNPGFYQLEMTSGRVPFTAGISRHADFLGEAQIDMGHRFTTGPSSGTISRRGNDLSGNPYVLDWWYGGWDHGGNTNAISMPYMMDEITAGARYWQVWRESPNVNAFNGGNSLNSDGVQLCCSSGNDNRLLSNFNDTTISANSGNASWTLAFVFKITNPGGTGMQNQSGRSIPLFSMGGSPQCPSSGGGACGGALQTSVEISVGRTIAGDACLAWGGSGTLAASICTNTAVISSTSTWYYLAVSAKAQGSGYPTVSMVLCFSGSCTEYGGVNMATSGNGTVGNGLVKLCGGSLPSCSANMIVASGQAVQFAHDPISTQSINGIMGEGGLWSGAVPNNVLREVYKTLRFDWTRTGRGSL
jgi:hypothetical protein